MEYGCIGRKLMHSFSKTIHNKLCDYEYELLELEPEQLEEFFKRRRFRAINVTIPYKQDVIAHLDEISDTARDIGAVNTIVNRDGRLYGYNTDFLGMRALILKCGMDFTGKKVVIAGSGGTSRTAYAVGKALNSGSVYRLSRSGGGGCISYDELYSAHADAQVLINTTPCGMYPNLSGAAVDIDRLTSLECVVDAVYNPLRSQLVMTARERGINASGGLYMLVAQAVYAAQEFLDCQFPDARIEALYKDVLAEKENIVLAGMPGCGKTTLGKLISKKLGREFVDTDELIVRAAGIPITEIFKTHGEQYFRELESQVIADIAGQSGLVISTGGGLLLREQNVFSLRQNGKICFIDRPPEQLVSTDSRPLSDSRQKLEALYAARLPVYLQRSDIRIDGSGDIETNLSRVLKEYGFDS